MLVSQCNLYYIHITGILHGNTQFSSVKVFCCSMDVPSSVCGSSLVILRCFPSVGGFFSVHDSTSHHRWLLLCHPCLPSSQKLIPRLVGGEAGVLDWCTIRGSGSVLRAALQGTWWTHVKASARNCSPFLGCLSCQDNFPVQQGMSRSTGPIYCKWW